MPSAVLCLLLVSSLFAAAVERALALFEAGQLPEAVQSLEQSRALDPQLFAANSLHYLRGRIAEKQTDWQTARQEFTAIPGEDPLFSLSRFHLALAALQVDDEPAARSMIELLPRNFPPSLLMRLAAEAKGETAVTIYARIGSRASRFEKAKLLEDQAELWNLVRERLSDDVGLEAATRLLSTPRPARETMTLAGVFYQQRQYGTAGTLYRSLTQIEEVAAEALYQIGRVHFQKRNYAEAVETYQSVRGRFPGSDWAHDAQYQIAACYWRIGDFANAEKAYREHLEKRPRSPQREGAVRNLVDVYRAMGEPAKAVALIDRTLSRKVSAVTRQVLLFSKAKVRYTQSRFLNALTLLRQLSRMSIRATPGGTVEAEVRYLQALCLEKLNRRTEAETIWRGLASNPATYYGQKAAARLGRPVPVRSDRNGDRNGDAIKPRGLRNDQGRGGAAIEDLIFLRLWDEAFLLIDNGRVEPDRVSIAAELARRAGQFHREILYADRLRSGDRLDSDSIETLKSVFPRAFADLIEPLAVDRGVDPLMIHSIIWQESKYNPAVRSGAAARGLMQFIPETAAEVANSIGLTRFHSGLLYHPETNLRLGVTHFSELLAELKSPEMALAAYNAGIDNVERWKRKAAGIEELFVADIGFEETKTYVLKVFEAHAFYRYLYAAVPTLK